MKRILLISSVLISSHFSFAQNEKLINFSFAQNEKLINDLSADICPCIDKAIKADPNVKMTELMGSCMGASFQKFKKEVGAITNNGSDQSKMRSLGEKIGKNLATTCPSFMELISTQGAAAMKDNNKNPFTEDLYNITDCKAFKEGKFVTIFNYINGNEIAIEDKTAYSISKNGLWTDYTENGKYNSVSIMTENSVCNISMTIKSNTNPKFDSMLKPGLKIEMKILGVDKKDPSKYYVLMIFNGMNIFQIIQKK